jgi:predicted dehydrogenase
VAIQDVRCIQVGYGGIGRGMVTRSLTRKPWYRTAAVVDVRDAALRQAQQDLGLLDAALFTSPEAALAAVEAEAVFINTPSELHYEQCRAALEAGRHVLVAKPITNDFEQAVRLVELAAAKRVTLSVGQQIRFNRHYLAVRRFVESGRIGQVEFAYFLNAKPRFDPLNLKDMDQPALYEMSCHHFDSLLALFPRAAPESIVADGFRPSWSRYAGPSMVNALIEFRDGPHVLYHGGFSSQGPLYELRLEGSSGALRCRGLHMSNDTMAYAVAAPGGQFGEERIDDGIPAANPFDRFFDVWYEYLAGGPEPPFSGRNNLKVFAMLAAGIDSIRTGGRVRIVDHPKYHVTFQRRE